MVITPGVVCKYWAKSGSPPIATTLAISFGVAVITDIFTSVFLSSASALYSNSSRTSSLTSIKKFLVIILPDFNSISSSIVLNSILDISKITLPGLSLLI